MGWPVYHPHSACSGDLILHIGKTSLGGAYLIQPDIHEDERGFFARTFCQEEMAGYGISTGIVQCNISYNRKKWTIRGMHYQIAPHEEAKFVSCPRGSIYDVVIDLRKESSTFLQWEAFELNEQNNRSLYIPGGCAHGFETLEPASLVNYQMTGFFHPESARGVRWNDPLFGISWPALPAVISDRDAGYPDFRNNEGENHE